MSQPSIPQSVLESAAQAFLAALPTHIRTTLNGRLERGQTLVIEGAVMPYKGRNHLFQVRSSNPYKPPFAYVVDLDALTCECPDHARGFHCKHILAAQIYVRSRLELLALRPF